MSYRIKTAATLTGVSTSTLRAWERRYNFVSPYRSTGGYRVYSDEDVARIARIKSLVDHGFKVSEAIALFEREVAPLPPTSVSADKLDALRQDLLQAFLRMDRASASRITDGLASLSFDRRVDELFLPVLAEIGDCWERGEANVAQEHFASAFVREKLMGILTELDSGPEYGREAICAGAPGELHETGLLAAAIHLALHGFRVTYLGPDLPLEDLGSSLFGRSPALVCTSLINRRTHEQCQAIARAFRRMVPPGTAVILGGRGIPEGGLGLDLPRVFLARSLHDMLETPPVQGKP
jgi:MerR family transcriptional regulator, light-induced transcriptional regulator